MKPQVGALMGVVLAVVAITGCSGRSVVDRQDAWASRTSAAGMHLASDERPLLASAPAMTEEAPAPLSVRCEPGQRAVVRQVPSAHGVVTEAACITDAANGWMPPPAPAPASHGPAYAQPYVPPAPAPAPRAIAADYRVEEPQPAPARVVYRDAPARTVYTEAPTRRVEPERRSWKKSAMIIGGSAGAGAGVGAIAGGKKGALIGAAIGGGGATVYEVAKR
jgi:hypothetical protein